MNIRQAKALQPGEIVHYTGLHACGRVAPGSKTRIVTRCRVTGQPKTWKTRSDEVKVPVKFGMYESTYITEDNLVDWHLESECPWNKVPDSNIPEPEDESQIDPFDVEPPIPFPIPVHSTEDSL